jgi:hypothetical protein
MGSGVREWLAAILWSSSFPRGVRRAAYRVHRDGPPTLNDDEPPSHVLAWQIVGTDVAVHDICGHGRTCPSDGDAIHLPATACCPES